MQAGEEPGFDPIESARVDSRRGGVGADGRGHRAAPAKRLHLHHLSSRSPPASAGGAGVAHPPPVRDRRRARSDWLEYETSDEGIHSAWRPETSEPKRWHECRACPGRARLDRPRSGTATPSATSTGSRAAAMLVLGNEGEGRLRRAALDRRQGRSTRALKASAPRDPLDEVHGRRVSPGAGRCTCCRSPCDCIPGLKMRPVGVPRGLAISLAASSRAQLWRQTGRLGRAVRNVA